MYKIQLTIKVIITFYQQFLLYKHNLEAYAIVKALKRNTLCNPRVPFLVKKKHTHYYMEWKLIHNFWFHNIIWEITEKKTLTHKNTSYIRKNSNFEAFTHSFVKYTHSSHFMISHSTQILAVLHLPFTKWDQQQEFPQLVHCPSPPGKYAFLHSYSWTDPPASVASHCRHLCLTTVVVQRIKKKKVQ